MENRWIVLLVLSVCLGGCARGRWDYGSMPREEAMKRAYDCQYMANMQAKGTGGAAPYIADRQFRDCMQSRGFEWIPEGESRQTYNYDFTVPDRKNDGTKGYLVASVDIEVVSSGKISKDKNYKSFKEYLESIRPIVEKYAREEEYDFVVVKGEDLTTSEDALLFSASKGSGAVARLFDKTDISSIIKSRLSSQNK